MILFSTVEQAALLGEGLDVPTSVVRCFPPAVPAPAIERPVVTALADGVECVVELDHMTAPAAVVDADRRPRALIDRVVTDRDFFRHRKDNAGDLLAYETDVVHEIVVNPTVARIVRRLRSRCQIDLVLRDRVTVLNRTASHGPVVSHRAHTALAQPRESAAGDVHTSVVAAEEDSPRSGPPPAAQWTNPRVTAARTAP